MRLTADQLAVCVGCRADKAEPWLLPFEAAMGRFEILTPARVAAFLAQVGHESGGLQVLEENLNYSAERLVKVFPKYFTEQEALEYARRPERIACRVYADRMGNGDEASGDGWRYRGRGLIQLTGKDNYAAASKGLGRGADLVSWPETVATVPAYAVETSAWFWKSRELDLLADQGDFRRITRAINGGYNGYDERLALWKRAKAVLGVA